MPTKHPILRAWFMVIIVAWGFAASGVQAQAFPSRPLRIVLLIGPGSSGDAVARFVADKLGAALGQPVVIENRPGAEGLVAVQSVRNAPADGYSILLASPSMLSGPLLNKAADYDLQRDFRMVSFLYRNSALLVTGRSTPFVSVGQAMAQARQQPGTVSLADYGNSYRIGGMLLAQQGGLAFNAVSYKGFSQASADVIGGTADLGLLDAGASMPLVRAGKLRALASTAKERLAGLPEVPTLQESGFAGYELYVWVALAVRRQTPDPVVRRLEQEVAAITHSPAFRQFLSTFSGTEPMPVSGVQADQELARESARYRGAVDAIRNAQR
ncbi:Bug family tripartite tricarboxylate transporter substrate binding protein [Cupriavidus alkaliphilus]|uniref:Bug family tripartite tricarboxylate transporter substrate binding protein n=1 Tax=Cupriavidus alkaliphilus TaxID=942866 RepID=UPI00161ED4E1|nr:tripartite tricarboxylate transporter substrate binding protein [Cupriavidus alkaliphilus]MBB2920000.1 tripartite-type tricarboxylate transporter receptor subunit TctC [Cupriavidus alkaliphilus]